MPGPNSAPNGDAKLVRGYGYDDKIWVEEKRGVETVWVQYFLRDHLARRGRLETGKTEKSR